MTLQARDATPPILIVPGLYNSGPDHWQTHWERALPGAVRVEQQDWERPLLGDWTISLAEAVRQREMHNVLALLDERREALEQIADAQAERLLADHRRVREAADARGRYKVDALKPVDVIAAFVLMPGAGA